MRRMRHAVVVRERQEYNYEGATEQSMTCELFKWHEHCLGIINIIASNPDIYRMWSTESKLMPTEFELFTWRIFIQMALVYKKVLKP